MNLPEMSVTGTHNTEEGLQRRLVEFRNLNTDDETVLNYFDELEIHPEPIGKCLRVFFRMHCRNNRCYRGFGKCNAFWLILC